MSSFPCKTSKKLLVSKQRADMLPNNRQVENLKQKISELEKEKKEYLKANQYLTQNTQRIYLQNKILKDAINERAVFYEHVLSKFFRSTRTLQTASDNNQKMSKIYQEYKSKVSSTQKSSKNSVFNEKIEKIDQELKNIQKNASDLIQKFYESEKKIFDYKILLYLYWKLIKINQVFTYEAKNFISANPCFFSDSRLGRLQRKIKKGNEIKKELSLLNFQDEMDTAKITLNAISKETDRFLSIYDQILLIDFKRCLMSEDDLCEFSAESKQGPRCIRKAEPKVPKAIDLDDEISELKRIVENDVFDYLNDPEREEDNRRIQSSLIPGRKNASCVPDESESDYSESEDTDGMLLDSEDENESEEEETLISRQPKKDNKLEQPKKNGHIKHHGKSEIIPKSEEAKSQSLSNENKSTRQSKERKGCKTKPEDKAADVEISIQSVQNTRPEQSEEPGTYQTATKKPKVTLIQNAEEGHHGPYLAHRQPKAAAQAPLPVKKPSSLLAHSTCPRKRPSAKASQNESNESEVGCDCQPEPAGSKSQTGLVQSAELGQPCSFLVCPGTREAFDESKVEFECLLNEQPSSDNYDATSSSDGAFISFSSGTHIKTSQSEPVRPLIRAPCALLVNPNKSRQLPLKKSIQKRATAPNYLNECVLEDLEEDFLPERATDKFCPSGDSLIPFKTPLSLLDGTHASEHAPELLSEELDEQLEEELEKEKITIQLSLLELYANSEEIEKEEPLKLTVKMPCSIPVRTSRIRKQLYTQNFLSEESDSPCEFVIEDIEDGQEGSESDPKADSCQHPFSLLVRPERKRHAIPFLSQKVSDEDDSAEEFVLTVPDGDAESLAKKAESRASEVNPAANAKKKPRASTYDPSVFRCQTTIFARYPLEIQKDDDRIPLRVTLKDIGLDGLDSCKIDKIRELQRLRQLKKEEQKKGKPRVAASAGDQRERNRRDAHQAPSSPAACKLGICDKASSPQRKERAACPRRKRTDQIGPCAALPESSPPSELKRDGSNQKPASLLDSTQKAQKIQAVKPNTPPKAGFKISKSNSGVADENNLNSLICRSPLIFND